MSKNRQLHCYFRVANIAIISLLLSTLLPFRWLVTAINLVFDIIPRKRN